MDMGGVLGFLPTPPVGLDVPIAHTGLQLWKHRGVGMRGFTLAPGLPMAKSCPREETLSSHPCSSRQCLLLVGGTEQDWGSWDPSAGADYKSPPPSVPPMPLRQGTQPWMHPSNGKTTPFGVPMAVEAGAQMLSLPSCPAALWGGMHTQQGFKPGEDQRSP